MIMRSFGEKKFLFICFQLTFIVQFELQVRKLDLILAEVVEQKCDCVITLGLNHARTTAVAARQVGLNSHLILFSSSQVGDLVMLHTIHP